MVEYGVNITNKFAFLSGDEEDTDELIAKAQLAAKQKEAALKKEAQNAAAAAALEKKAPTNSVNKENVDNRRPPRRDGPPRQFNNNNNERRTNVRGHPRKTDENGSGVHLGGDSQRPSRQFNNNRPSRDGPPRDGQAPRDGLAPRRYPPRPRVEGEEPNNNFGGENRPPRRFNDRRGPPRGDRVSGSDKTGVRSVPKRDGAGRGNWGTEADEMAAANDTVANPPAANESASDNIAAKDTPATGEENAMDGVLAVDAPPQTRELTLEEWKAQNKHSLPNFNIRKPGESAAEKKIYQKLVPLKRADPAEKKDSKTEEAHPKREPRERALNIEVSFNGSQRRGGGGGGRFRNDAPGSGGDRRGAGPSSSSGYGNRGPAGQRGPQVPGGNRGGSNAQQFNLEQESFPALGAC